MKMPKDRVSRRIAESSGCLSFVIETFEFSVLYPEFVKLLLTFQPALFLRWLQETTHIPARQRAK